MSTGARAATPVSEAAIGVVVADADETVIDETAERIGVATNNVAEYRAVLRGIDRAQALGAGELQLVNDSGSSRSRAVQGQAPRDETAIRRGDRGAAHVRALEHPHRAARRRHRMPTNSSNRALDGDWPPREALLRRCSISSGQDATTRREQHRAGRDRRAGTAGYGWSRVRRTAPGPSSHRGRLDQRPRSRPTAIVPSLVDLQHRAVLDRQRSSATSTS